MEPAAIMNRMGARGEQFEHKEITVAYACADTAGRVGNPRRGSVKCELGGGRPIRRHIGDRHSIDGHEQVLDVVSKLLGNRQLAGRRGVIEGRRVER